MSNKALCSPNHIAIIMDGNGRWATKRGLPRNLGHKQGIKAIEKTIDACLNLNIKTCTFFAFSTENWKRSKEEIDGIFSLVRDYLKNNKNFFKNKGVRIDTIGVLDPFPQDLRETLQEIKQDTKNLDKLTVVFALNYGGRDDIVRAVNTFVEKGEKANEKSFLDALDTSCYPQPDIVIRTSGEQRISNFLLYQMAYSELYFPKVLWPDFNQKHLVKILKDFNKRERRFGGIK